MVGWSQSTQRKPTQTQGEHTNSTKKDSGQAGIQTANLLAVRWQCLTLFHSLVKFKGFNLERSRIFWGGLFKRRQTQSHFLYCGGKSHMISDISSLANERCQDRRINLFIWLENTKYSKYISYTSPSVAWLHSNGHPLSCCCLVCIHHILTRHCKSQWQMGQLTR